MITKEELLVAFEESTRTLELNNQIFGLALKGLESESTVKRLIQDRDNCKMMHKDLTCEHRIAVGTLNDTVDGLTRSRNQWRKKHDDLADELDGKIIALEEKLKSKDADLAVASKMIDDAQAKHGALQAQLKNTIPLQFHNAWEDDLLLTIISLRDERDAFQRSVSEMHTENNCMRADLENMCKERDALKDSLEKLKVENANTVSLKYHDELISSASRRVNALLRERVDLVSEIKNWGETDRAKNADIDALQRVVGEMHAENNCMRADLEKLKDILVGAK